MQNLIFSLAFNISLAFLSVGLADDTVLSTTKALDDTKDIKKWGYIDTSGKFVIAPQFQRAKDFSEGLACVLAEKWGYIDKKGTFVIKPTYRWGSCFKDGLSPIKSWLSGGYGFIDKTGTVLREASYFSAAPFSDGLARVSFAEGTEYYSTSDGHGYERVIGEVFGFVNRSGLIVIWPQFEWVDMFSEDFACARRGKKFGFINKQGDFVIEPRFDYCSSFSNGFAAVKVGNRCGYIDKTGRVTIDLRFEVAGDFCEGIAPVNFQGNYGFIDKAGKFVIEPQFSITGTFSEGLAAVKVGDKWGFINKQGDIVIKPEYISSPMDIMFQNNRGMMGVGSIRPVRDFSEGLTGVNVEGKWGFINKAGKAVVPFRFGDISDFHEGCAAVLEISFSNTVIDQAWNRSNGKCECTRSGHNHTGRCNSPLSRGSRGYEGPYGWEVHYKVAGGPDTLSNCEILCHFRGCSQKSQAQIP